MVGILERQLNNRGFLARLLMRVATPDRASFNADHCRSTSIVGTPDNGRWNPPADDVDSTLPKEDGRHPHDAHHPIEFLVDTTDKSGATGA